MQQHEHVSSAEEQDVMDKFSLLPVAWHLLDSISQGQEIEVTKNATNLLQKIDNAVNFLDGLDQIDLANEEQEQVLKQRLDTVAENNKKIEQYRKLAVFEKLDQFSSNTMKMKVENNVKE
eukprot:CFRG2114T1